MTHFKTYKRISAAAKAAGGRPIVKVGDLYLVPQSTDLGQIALAEVSILKPTRPGETDSWSYAGNVSLHHLNRLGNANWAERSEKAGSNPNLIDWHPEAR